MRRRLIILSVITALLFTGCSKNNQSEIDNAEQTTTESVTTTATESQDNQAENAEENESITEPYMVIFEANTIDGETITSDCFAQSKLTMLNVWATYCNPCLNEMPDLGEIAASYDVADFQMYGIVSDIVEGAAEDEIAVAKDLVEQTNANYPHMILNQSLYSTLVGAVEAVPTTFFVNQKGELLGYVVGAQSKQTWEELINELLEEME